MVKHADRWPPAYYKAINQLADVIATFPPEKVPPLQLREVTDDLEIALNRRHRADYEALCHAGFAYHFVQERERRRERRRAGARMRPRHAHVRSLKGGSNGPPTCHPRKCQTLPLWWHIQRHILCERGKELCSITAAQDD